MKEEYIVVDRDKLCDTLHAAGLNVKLARGIVDELSKPLRPIIEDALNEGMKLDRMHDEAKKENFNKYLNNVY